MKQHFVLSILLLSLITLGCAHIAEYNARNYEPVEIDNLANRTFQSPWPNQPEFGYREWLRGKQTLFDIPFVFDDQKVISLAPDESITIEFDPPIQANAVSFITSANFVYNNKLAYRVDISSDRALPNDGQFLLSTPEWVRGLGEESNSFGDYDIFVDGHAARGQLTHNQQVFSNTAVPVNGIHIQNTNGTSMQHLTIAAITLVNNPSLSMGVE